MVRVKVEGREGSGNVGLLLTGLAAALLTVGCAATAPPVRVEGVAIAAERDVAACDYLDDVHGSSGWYGTMANAGYQNARQEALQQAGMIGATHVVWVPLSQGYGSTQVHGKAYRCGR